MDGSGVGASSDDERSIYISARTFRAAVPLGAGREAQLREKATSDDSDTRSGTLFLRSEMNNGAGAAFLF